MSRSRQYLRTHRFRFLYDRNGSECCPCYRHDCRWHRSVLQQHYDSVNPFAITHRHNSFIIVINDDVRNLTRVPVLAVNAVIAITMTGLIRMIAGVLGPAPRRTYPTRSRPNGRVVIRVEIAGRQSDARDMLTSVSRELIGRPNSCTTYNLRIVRFGNAKKTG